MRLEIKILLLLLNILFIGACSGDSEDILDITPENQYTI